MKPRSRTLAAVAAMIALTFSFAEGVWASSCMPGMEMSAGPDGAAPSVHGAMMETPPHMGDSRHRTPDDPDRPNCPFTPLSTSGACLVAASLPASLPAGIAVPPAARLLIHGSDQSRDLLLVSAHFHPPRV